MKISITSETISQQTIYGDNEGLNLNTDMDSSKEQTELEGMQNNLEKIREIYFKYFSSQRMACTKATVQKRVIISMPVMHSLHSEKGVAKKMGKKGEKGKTPCIGVKHLEKIQPGAVAKPAHER